MVRSLSLCLGVCLTLLAWAGAAQARTCVSALEQNIRYARDPVLNLLDYERLERYTKFVSEHADEVFIDPDQDLRLTISLLADTNLFLGFRDCRHGDALEGDVNSTVSNGGAVLTLTHAPLDLELSIFATGRMDGGAFGAFEDDVPTGERFPYFLTQGLVGGRLQVTRWFEAGFSTTGVSSITGDLEPIRSEVPVIDAPTARYYALGVPEVGLRLWFTEDDELVDVRTFELRDLPLTEALSTDLAVRRLVVEGRAVVVPRLMWSLDDRESMSSSVGGEIGVESEPASIRHGRLIWHSLMALNKITRTSFSRIGIRIEQSASITLHRGVVMREITGSDFALGATYESRVGMQSPYIYFFMHFGLSFNAPEMLDLMPHTRNHGMLSLGMNLATRI